MDIRVIPTGFEYDQVLIKGDSLNIFEYHESAEDFLDESKVDGEVVQVFYCSLVNLAFADVSEDGEFAGYGVLTHDDWGDPVLL